MLTDLIDRRKSPLAPVRILELSLFLLVGFLVSVEAFWSYAQVETLINKKYQRQFQALSNATANSLSDIIIRRDYGELESFLKLSMADNSVVSLLVVDATGKVLINLVKKNPDAAPTLVFDINSIDLNEINLSKKQTSHRYDETFWAAINPQSPVGWVRLGTQDDEAKSLMQFNRRAIIIKASIVGILFMTVLFSLIRYARKIIREKQQDFDQRNHELLDAVRTDALTRIPNRVGFTQMIADFQVDRLASKPRKPFAICFMDLDSFKEVNDTYGHQVGDELLIQVAQRLLNTVRNSDVIARLAGDEFVLLIDDFGGRNQLKKILNRIISDINVPFVIHNYVVRVSISIGVTISPPDEGSGELLIQHADKAMYAAKNQGRNRWVIFDRKVVA